MHIQATRVESLHLVDQDTDQLNAYLSLGWKLLSLSNPPYTPDDGREMAGDAVAMIMWPEGTGPAVYPKGSTIELWGRVPEGAKVVPVSGYPAPRYEGPVLEAPISPVD
jgi:hypothetical protein